MTQTVIVPDDVNLTEEDMEKIRAQLQGETVDVIKGTRAGIVFAKEKNKIKTKEEVGKAKDLPIEKIKMP